MAKEAFGQHLLRKAEPSEGTPTRPKARGRILLPMYYCCCCCCCCFLVLVSWLSLTPFSILSGLCLSNLGIQPMRRDRRVSEDSPQWGCHCSSDDGSGC